MTAKQLSEKHGVGMDKIIKCIKWIVDTGTSIKKKHKLAGADYDENEVQLILYEVKKCKT